MTTWAELYARGVREVPGGIEGPEDAVEAAIAERDRRVQLFADGCRPSSLASAYGMCDTCLEPLPRYRGGMCPLCCAASKKALELRTGGIAA